MNKLEEYKNTKIVEYCPKGTLRHEAYEKGFDAAIALDLPVKFNLWKATNMYAEDFYRAHKLQISMRGVDKEAYLRREKELYQYWIDNIYEFK